MDPKVQQELMNKLDLLAQKLGVTAQFLWGVLVRQARIEAISLGTIIVITIFLCVYVLMAWTKIDRYISTAKAAYNSWSDSYDEKGNRMGSRPVCIQDYEDYFNLHSVYCLMLWTLTFAAVIFVIISMFTLGDFVTDLLNPNFYAFQHIKDIL